MIQKRWSTATIAGNRCAEGLLNTIAPELLPVVREPVRLLVPAQREPLLDDELRAQHFAEREARIIARYPNSPRAKRARAQQEAEQK